MSCGGGLLLILPILLRGALLLFPGPRAPTMRSRFFEPAWANACTCICARSLALVPACANPSRPRRSRSCPAGTLPKEIALNEQLEEFKVEHNALTGTIPSEYGGMNSLVSTAQMARGWAGHAPRMLIRGRRAWDGWAGGGMEAEGAPQNVCRPAWHGPLGL